MQAARFASRSNCLGAPHAAPLAHPALSSFIQCCRSGARAGLALSLVSALHNGMRWVYSPVALLALMTLLE